VSNKTLFVLIAGASIAASILPSLVTQANWLSPEGLMPLEQRRKWLLYSWIAVIIIFIGLYVYANGHKIGRML
jgi:hypothetical protein